ncbi:unnamed protein product [Nippostrongylus brasiliensis]|uniref:BED-type domain-containing protein n=1 Tax=Nippostrongylus brasiliensis TaxID=27835 RepID=A0A158QZJ7_NIPBR|nr:unnamed protein product [Nippostrongylus brasiliensis]
MGPIATTTALGSAVSLPTGLTLGNIDITNSWCQFPNYHDIRPVENGGYEAEVGRRALFDSCWSDKNEKMIARSDKNERMIAEQLQIASINYQDISSAQKYEPLKYDYGDIRPKQYEEQRLYHKEPDRPIKEEDVKFEADERSEPSRDGAAPAKRGRPTENPCWGYFIRLDDQNVVKSACATNMTKHLERHHQQDYQQLIVQIKQYRQQKGPLTGGMSSPETHQQSCILSTNQYVKTDNYAQHMYSQFDREDVLRNCTGYDRHDPSLTWQRGQWSQWPANHDATTSGIDMTGVLHGCLSSPTAGWATTTPGTSATADKPYMKRNRKTEHPVWEYFKRTADGNAQCGICTGVVKSPCSSNFMRHLMRHHSPEYNDVYVKWVQKRAPNK